MLQGQLVKLNINGRTCSLNLKKEAQRQRLQKGSGREPAPMQLTALEEKVNASPIIFQRMH